MSAVSVSICYYDEAEVRINDLSEEQLIVELKKNGLKFCIDNELDLWKKIREVMSIDRMNYLISFNGAFFDNIFLLNSIKKHNKLVNIIINSGMLEIESTYKD